MRLGRQYAALSLEQTVPCEDTTQARLLQQYFSFHLTLAAVVEPRLSIVPKMLRRW